MGRNSKVNFALLIAVFVSALSILNSPSARAFDRAHMIIPYSIWMKSSCALVTIHSLSPDVTNGGELHRKGVGWSIVLSNGNYVVITPYHVVAGSESILIQCRDRLYAAGAVSYSPNKDLALLVFATQPTPEEIMPLIFMNSHEEMRKMFGGLPKNAQAVAEFLNPDMSSIPFLETLNRAKRAGVLLPEMGNENRPLSADGGSGSTKLATFVRLQRSDEGILTDLDAPLIIEGLAIRPGFSGSPVYIELPTDKASPRIPPGTPGAKEIEDAFRNRTRPIQVVGMLTKTELNGVRSAAISIEDIMTMLPRLIAGRGNLDDSLPVEHIRYDYMEQQTHRGSFLVRAAFQKTPEGRRNWIAETCDNDYRNSSDQSTPSFSGKWTEAYKSLLDQRTAPPEAGKKFGLNLKGADLFKSLQQFDKRTFIEKKNRLSGRSGDYGDGGDDPLATTEFLIEDSARQGTISTIAAFKDNSACLMRGLTLSDGRVVNSLRRGGVVTRLTSLPELVVLSRTIGSKIFDEVYRFGTTENSIDSICSESRLQKDQRLSFEAPFLIDRAVEAGSRSLRVIQKFGLETQQPSNTYLQCRSIGDAKRVFSIAFSDQASRSEARWLTSAFGDTFIATSAGTGIQRDKDAHKLSFRFQASSDGKIDGLGLIGTQSRHCAIKLSNANVAMENPWRYSIRDSRLNATIDIASGAKTLVINVTKVDPSCLNDLESNKLWLLKAEYGAHVKPLLLRIFEIMTAEGAPK